MIQIDLEWLVEAIENHDDFVHHYLNTQTGEIRRVNEMFESIEDQQEMARQMDETPERWITIDPYPSREGFRLMEEFTQHLPEGEDRRALERALSGTRPFSNFRHTLRDMATLRGKWFVCQRRKMIEAAREWLDAAGIVAELR